SARRRSVVAWIRAGSLLASMSRRHSAVTISRLRSEISVKAKTVSANSGTARMSCINRRVNPIDPAPIMAILNGMMSVYPIRSIRVDDCRQMSGAIGQSAGAVAREPQLFVLLDDSLYVRNQLILRQLF